MAAALVQTKTSSGSSGPTLSATFDNPTASGNTVVVSVTGRVGSSTPATFVSTDSFANTYTVAVSTQNGGLTQVAAILYAFNISGGASHAVTISTSNVGSGLAMIATEWSGLTTTSPFDKKAASAGATGTITSTSTPGLVQADELAVAGANNRTGLLTEGTGYTLIANAIGVQHGAGEYAVVASTNGVTATFASTASANWVCAVATFTIAAAAAAAARRDALMLLGIT